MAKLFVECCEKISSKVVEQVNFAGRGGRPTARLSVEEAKFQVLEICMILLFFVANDMKLEAWLNLYIGGSSASTESVIRRRPWWRWRQ